MNLYTLIGTFIATVAVIWLDFIYEKYLVKDEVKTVDKTNIIRKRKFNWIKTIILFVVFFVSFIIMKKQNEVSAYKDLMALNSQNTIDDIDSASKKINKLVDKIKVRTEGISDSLDSIGKNVNNQFSKTQKNLNYINSATDYNFKTTSSHLSEIAYQSKRLQYPIPEQIETQFTFKWLVEGVDNSFKQEIKRLNKKTIDYEWGTQENYRIDSDFGQYALLCLSHKNLLLIIEKGDQKVIYKTILYPEKLKQTVSEFYFSYERNTYRNFTITYNERRKTITLEGKECPFYLLSSSKQTTSLLDLDGANITLLVNSEDYRLTHHFNADNRVEYIFGYTGYEANDGTKLIGYEILNFNISMLNGKYSFNSVDTTKSKLKFSLGKF